MPSSSFDPRQKGLRAMPRADLQGGRQKISLYTGVQTLRNRQPEICNGWRKISPVMTSHLATDEFFQQNLGLTPLIQFDFPFGQLFG